MTATKTMTQDPGGDAFQTANSASKPEEAMLVV